MTAILVFAEVHPFDPVAAETVAVGIVTSEEAVQVPKEPELKPQPSDAFDLASKSAPSESPAPPPQPSPPAPLAAAPYSPPPDRRPAVAQPQAPSTSPLPAYVPPEPDLSIKYQVILGLPPDLPPSLPQARSGDAFDDQSLKASELASSLIAEFRRHLRTCSKLPPSVAPSDKIRIVLRVLMTPDAKLAAEPLLVEASASAKGPALMQGAIAALEACQPYAMLPVDRYGEWKVLDLGFTPHDFAGG